MTFAAAYAIAVGALMIGQWPFVLTRRQVPELKSEPLRTALHLVGEAVTVIALIVGGLFIHQG